MKKLTKNALILSTSLLFSTTASVLFASELEENLQPTREILAPNAAQAAALKLPIGVLADTTATAAAQSTAVNQSYLSTAWFQTINLTLKSDFNNNGYYSRLYIRFDANTEYTRQPAYAVYSLIGNGGYETIIYTSTVFNLSGVSNQDWFAIETDIKTLPRGMYKLRIQLKDAQTGYNLAEISGYDTATLDRMALEDTYNDEPAVYYEESAGSVGILSILGLSCLYYFRRKSRIEQSSATRC